jgi:replicative DNA helicase
MIQGGRLVTALTLAPFFEDAEPISQELTVPKYLGTLVANASINVREYAEAIVDLARHRAMIVIGEELVNGGYDVRLDLPAKQKIEDAQASLDQTNADANVTRVIAVGDAARQSLERANKAYAAGGGLAGISSGFAVIDRRTGGFSPGHVVIIGGRPSMGKTALATNIAQNIAAAGKPVGFFSLEMEAIDLSDRILARMSGVPADIMTDGRFSRDQFAAWMAAQERLQTFPLLIESAGSMTIQQLAASARRMKRKHGLAVLIVDYLQKLKGVNYRGGRDSNRQNEVTEVMDGLVAIAKDLQVPVIALAQLSRENEKRGPDPQDKRPQMSDLRESGSIEMNADVVMFPFREAYYLEDSPPDVDDPKRPAWEQRMDEVRDVAEIIFAKIRHRSKAAGSVRLGFAGALTSFYELDEVRR